MKRKAAVLTVLVVLLCAGIYSSFGRRPKSGDQWQLQPGSTLVYELSYEASGRSDSPGNGILNQALTGMDQAESQTLVKGLLALHVVSPKEVKFRLQLQTIEAQPLVWQQQLNAGPFTGLIRLQPSGHIEEFQLAQNSQQGAAWLIRDILALMEVNFPETSQDSWMGIETHPGHDVKVQWKTDVRDAKEWTLQKQYAANQDPGIQVSGQGIVRMETESKAWLAVSVQRDRQLGEGKQPRSFDTAKLVLKRSTESISDPAQWVLGQTPWSDNLKAEKSQKTMQHDQYLRELGDESIEAILGQLEAAGDVPADKLVNQFMKVKAFIALYPDRLSVLAKELQKYGAQDARFGVIAAALRSVGDAAAQTFMQDQIRGWDDEPMKQRQMIPHLAFVKDPLPQSEALLQGLAQNASTTELKQTAELGLGIMGSSLQVKEKDRADHLQKNFAEKLQKATEVKDQQHYLRVIGNLAMTEALPAVQPFLDERQSMETRVTAIRALRGMTGVDARSLLLQHLQTSPAPELREAAGEALAFTEGQESDLQVYERVLFSETHVGVLKAVIAATGKLALKSDLAWDLLQRFNAACGKTDVCSFAQSVLSSVPSRR